MRLLEYRPDHFDLLYPAAVRMRSRNLLDREFVNYYYASAEWCRLNLVMSDADVVIGAVGIERMPFRYGSEEMTIGFGTNYHSLEPGTGGFLFLHWMKSCPMGISFGGSEFAHNIIRSQRWPYFDGIGMFHLNKPYEVYAGEPVWKRTAKWIARQATRRPISMYGDRIPQAVAKRISVREETRYSHDLLPHDSPFAFRFAPGADYLEWRYNTELPFVRYRLFRILADGRTTGYVIFNERPDRVLVSQCDGENAETLAWGALLGLLDIGRADRVERTVTLTCCNPAMQNIYRSFGFKWDSDHPFALGSLRRGIGPPPGSDTSQWLVNFDWGDNGLMDLLSAAQRLRAAEGILKLDESCTSNPKSEISNWTG